MRFQEWQIGISRGRMGVPACADALFRSHFEP
ncbi:hypothetical protein SAMN05444161_0202 [Rhizobiales bacterium GAS191]|jgi:hypothetical protein|nr:hypothetical protein SAMN05519103_07696 [Rhizobiales bacterium GAS113]SEB94929.1 hypothetical protein SAMN05444161_0202 [Rhizobiales bacterium GAS191]SED23414.1 hypothetical protein SAMN05519104_3100 [Rhizobiales bacterium GAS188]